MKIVVCVKPVPSNVNVTIDPETKTVRRQAGDNIVSTLDKNAIELAAKLKKQLGGEIIVLSMTPASAELCIREALARGGDRAIILSDRVFAGGDTFSTSHVLSEAIKKIGDVDLVLAGAYSDDGGTGQMAAQLGEWLNIPHLHNAEDVKVSDNELRVTTRADKQIYEWISSLPAVVTVGRNINKVSPPSVRNIMMAQRKSLEIWTAADLPCLKLEYVGLRNSPTQNGNLFPLDNSRAGEVFEGDADEIAAAILSRLQLAGIQI